MGKWTFPSWLASWVGLAFVKTSYPFQIGPSKKGRSMRKGKRRRRRRRDEVWLPVMGGPLDGGACEVCSCTSEGFKYITENGAIHVYQYQETPTEEEGVFECCYRHVEVR